MNGDRSNHQGRVKVAQKAALPSVAHKAALPPAFQKLHATMCHSERSEESRSGSYFRITSSPAQAADLPERRARFLAALGMTPDAAAARRLVVFGAFALLTLSVVGRGPYPCAATPAPPQVKTAEPEYLTPVELNFSPDGQRIYVVCEGNDSVLAMDARTQRVVAHVKVGSKPRGLAVSPDGKTLYVSNSWSDTVSEIDAGSLQVRRTLKSGWGPVGLTTDRRGKFLYVANSVGNDVSLFDLTTGAEIKRFMTQRYPEQILLSGDGRRVYVSNVLPHFGPYDKPPVSELLVIDAVKQIVKERILVPGAIELRHIAEAPKPLGNYLLVPEIRPKNLGPLIAVAQGWVMTHGMAVVRPHVGTVRPAAQGLRAAGREPPPQVTQVILDDVDYYYAGENGAAFTPDGHYALVTASEANTLTIIDTARLARRLHEVPSDELPNRLDSAQAFVVRRLKTGYDPQAVVVSPDGRLAYIANRLEDTLTVVDLARLQIASTVDLGGPKELTALRRGERVFNAAKYCFQGQFACATCHPNRHLDGVSWNLETPQLGRDRVANRTLRGIKDTAPYKWNGKNPDLATQCGPRIAKFLFRSEGFNTQELEDLITYINQIPLPPNRHLAADGQLTEAQERGKAIFYRTLKNDGSPIAAYNQCATCHPADTHYTSRTSFDVGSANKYDTISSFDTPQLDRVYEDGPYLHNGEALTLEEIWTVFNNNDTHGVTSDMAKEQLNDLIEFLKTL
ncbi:MAG: beta-propeller fold lactonase family protein [Terriglobia bacterium]|jgi:YVTN family beta-propeller protein